MSSILAAAGFENLESLQEFSNRFPNVFNYLDDDLKKVWICHKNSSQIPTNEEIYLSPFEDFRCLSKKVLKRIAAGKHFRTLLTEFSALIIFNKIYVQFKKQLTSYLFTKCYLFYNWGIDAFEPLIDHFEIHSIIQKRQRRSFKKVQRKLLHNFPNPSDAAAKERGTTLCDRQLGFKKPKQVSFNSVEKAVKGEGKFYNYLKNEKNPYQEKFSMKRILYDMKEKSWPKSHVLNKTVDDLIRFIIQVPVVTGVHIEGVILNESKKWMLLKELLEKFMKTHKQLIKNDGYGRVLKKHLKSVKTARHKSLHPIPKSTVCSYIFDILRRTLPRELFGINRVRKTFFKQLAKVINGSKDESFIWYPLLRTVLLNKSNMAWCSQLGSIYIQSQMILKLFKFIILHYVFVMLRNNFYVTETGSSGFSLRFYRKSDMERASSACLENLLREGHIQRLSKGSLESDASIERNWLETGNILERDLRKNLKKSLIHGTEYTQPIARVRFLPKNDSGDELRIITNIPGKRGKDSVTKIGSKKLEEYFKTRLAKRKKNLFFVKLFLQYLVDKKGFGIRPVPCNSKLEAAWAKAVYLKEKHGELYFVKADISDAFGSVNYETLTEVLKRAFEDEVKGGKVRLKKIIEWKRVGWKSQKVVRFSFSNRPAENSIMIHRSVFLSRDKKINHCLDLKFLGIINQVVMQQRVEIKGKVFKLIKGLAQGSAGKFSTHLCEIYYSAMDESEFGRFVNSSDSVLVRGVDDYLFITSDIEKAKGFLNLVQNGIPNYKVRFNSHKLKSNLLENIKEVSYLGLVFNFEEMWVKPSYSNQHRKGLLSTMNMFDKWGANHFNKQIFLKRRSLRLKCLKLHSIVTSKLLNSLKITRRTVFEACVMQSLRVLILSDYLFPGNMKSSSAVYQTLLMSCSRIKKTVASCEISKDEVNWLFFFSALNVSYKFSGQFKVLLLLIRFHLQKCEKAFAESGAELLLNLLKNDILDEDYWKEVRGTFKELRQRPLKVA